MTRPAQIAKAIARPRAKEHQRDARMFRWLAGWPMDLKLGGRMLVKYPGLTFVGAWP